MSEQEEKKLALTMWNIIEGGVAARLDANPDGIIRAKDEKTLRDSLNILTHNVGQRVYAHFGKGNAEEIADLGLQGRWKDGRFHIRCLALPDFEVNFSSEDAVRDFMGELAVVAPRVTYKPE